MAVAQIAEETLDKLDQQLICSICLETYTDPKLLRCGHYFCLKCLVKLLHKDERQRFYLRCPSCRTNTRIPNTNVAGLQPAFHINDLKSIRDNGREALKNVRHCQEHGSRELEVYCKACKEVICLLCAIQGGKHHSHDHELLQELSNKLLKELQEDLVPSCLETLDELSSKLQTALTHIETMTTATPQNNEEQLKFLKEKKESTSSGRSKISRWKDKLANETEKFVRLFEEPSRLDEVIESQRKAHQNFISLVGTVRKGAEQVEVPTLLDPLMCSVIVESLREAVIVGKTARVILNVLGCTGPEQDDVSNFIKCEVICVKDESGVQCHISRCWRQNQYEISYQPTEEGEHRLHIKIYHCHIRGSPFSITVAPETDKHLEMMDYSTMVEPAVIRHSMIEPVRYRTMGRSDRYPIRTFYDVSRPAAVAVNQREEIFVYEKSRKRISLFSRGGAKQRTFLTGFSSIPLVMTADSSHVLFAGNGMPNGTVFKLGEDGEITALVSIPRPKCIAFSTSSNKLYALSEFDHVLVVSFGYIYNSRSHWPCTGHALACDDRDKVYVVDKYITIFTSEGRFVRRFGFIELNRPVAIAVDNFGVVYVSDLGKFCISLFTSNGSFLTSFGCRGGQFAHPGALAVDSRQTLYVCDHNRSCVQVFDCKDVMDIMARKEPILAAHITLRSKISPLVVFMIVLSCICLFVQLPSGVTLFIGLSALVFGAFYHHYE